MLIFLRNPDRYWQKLSENDELEFNKVKTVKCNESPKIFCKGKQT